MLSFAPTLMTAKPAPVVVVNRPTAKDLLTYSVSAAEPYSYYQGNDLTYLNNEPGRPSEGFGVIKAGGGSYRALLLIVTFSNPVWLNEVQVVTGQFNGYYNAPLALTIYRGNTVNNPILNAEEADNLNQGAFGGTNPMTTFDLLGNAAFDEPSNTYLFRFYNGQMSDYVSVMELLLFGALA
jgi:hypothetical protein